ncbi:transmembrane protein [Perilla frutescens var. hirtella]|nr:transmembrane protein [Perilla frutescens var. hirtella]
MDIVEATNDFQDWELLQSNSDSETAPVSALDSGNSFDEIDSGGLIQANYFSLGPHDRYEERMDDAKSVGSDNPGWIDPRLGEPNKESGEFWSDSGSERSEDRKFSGLEETNGLGFPENEEKGVKFELIEEKEEAAEDLGNYSMETGGIDGDSAKFSDDAEGSQVGVEGNVDLHVESQVLGEEMNGNEGIESGDMHVESQVLGEEMSGNEGIESGDMHVESRGLGEEMNENEGIAGGDEIVDGRGKNNSGELEKRGVVWWKMPMEFLKYCMIRMSPVWTASVAAAVVGFVILGRRLYKMKRKTRGLEIKVAVDDKKASQAMSRAARLNEAFSVVKLVPVIRPSLPAIGSTSNWSVVTLR